MPTGTFQNLTWLYQMVQGPPGPTGAVGPVGPTGPLGPTGPYGSPAIMPPGELYVIKGLISPVYPYFSTIQAAINAVNVTAPNASRINLPGGSTTFTEDLSFPDGAAIEIVCDDPYAPAQITGNMTDPVGANAPRFITLTNVQVNGNITINGNGVFSFLSISFVGGGGDTAVTGDISCPGYRLRLTGGRPGQSFTSPYTTTYQAYCTVSGNITAAVLMAYSAAFPGGKTTTIAGFAEYNQCAIRGARTHVSPFTTLILTACAAAQTFLGSVRADDFSSGFLLRTGVGVTGGSYRLMNESWTVGPLGFAANVGSTVLVGTATGPQPTGLYKVEASMNRLGEGSSGVAALSVAGVDESGSWSRIVATMGCSTGSGDTRTSGSVLVRSNGSAKLTYSISGVVGAGFSGTYETNARRRTSQNT